MEYIGTTSRTANAQSAHTLSGIAQITASTASAYNKILVKHPSPTSNRLRWELYKGSSGNEVKIAEGWQYRINDSTLPSWEVYFDEVPAGERLSFAVAFADASSGTASPFFFHGDLVDDLAGVDETALLNMDPAATQPDPTLTGNGTTANADGTPVVMVSDTTEPIARLWVTPMGNNETVTGNYVITLAYGPTGSAYTDPSTVEIVTGLRTRRRSGTDVYNDPMCITLDAPIPVGSDIFGVLAAPSTSAGAVGMRVLLTAVLGTPTPSSGGALVATENDVQYESRQNGGNDSIIQIRLVDDAGDAMTGLVFGDLTVYKSVDTAAAVVQALVDGTLGAYTALGFKEISPANMPGEYQFCPDTHSASGKREVLLFRATGMRDMRLAIDLSESDPRVAVPTPEELAIEALITGLMGRGHSIAIDGTDWVLFDTDGTTELARAPYTRLPSAVNPLATLGPG